MNRSSTSARRAAGTSRIKFLSLAVLAAVLFTACAHAPASITGARRVLLAHDDGRAQEPVAFPGQSHECLVRFELPPGKHSPARLWWRMAAAGTVVISLYDSSPLDAPGELLYSVTRAIGTDDVSDGKDGRWVTEDFIALAKQTGVVWVGVKKAAGDAALWSSRSDGGQYFVRNHDPQSPLTLTPVRKAPLVRLELTVE